MGRGLFPIILTLLILAIIFGGWYVIRKKGCFINPHAEDITICLGDSGTVLFFQCVNPDFGLRGIEYVYTNDEVVDIGFYFGRYSDKKLSIKIDTVQTTQIKLCGELYKIKNLRICE